MPRARSALLAQAGALALNLASGIGVVLANKLAFTSAKFAFPTALTALHYGTNYALLLCLAAVQPSSSSSSASAAPLDRELVATTAVWALHNALSNLSLSRNSVGLYQISKILVTPLIVGLEFVAYRRLPHPRLALPLVGACAGVALATVSDVSFELRGALIAAASACVSAVLKVLQQDVLQRRGWSSLDLMRRTWGPQLLLLLVCAPLLDTHFSRLATYELTPARGLVLLLSCAAAFALNVSSLVAIQLTSAVAIVLLSQGKTAATMLGGYLFFDGQPNARQLAGASIAVLSLGAYSYGSALLAERKTSTRDTTGDFEAQGEHGGTLETRPRREQEEEEPLRGQAA